MELVFIIYMIMLFNYVNIMLKCFFKIFILIMKKIDICSLWCFDLLFYGLYVFIFVIGLYRMMGYRIRFV